MLDIDYKKKYLKYKKKYILNKHLNQKGGERHEGVIQKTSDGVRFKDGFNLQNLGINGDYHIIHAYDPDLVASQRMKNKLDQLNTWLSQTFNYPPLPLDGVANVNKAARIHNSAQKQELIDLVNWLLDPRDN